MPDATTSDGEIPCNPGTPAEAAASNATATPVGMAPPAAWVKKAAIPRWDPPVGQPMLHPVSYGGRHEAQRHDQPGPTEECRRSGGQPGQRSRHHPSSIGMWRLDQVIEARPGHVNLDRFLGNVPHQRLESLEACQVGGAHLDTAHHGHRVGIRATVIRDRDGREGHVDVNRAKAIGVDEAKGRGHHVRSRSAGGQQRLANPHRKVDDGPRGPLIHPVVALPQGDQVPRCGAVPHSAPGPVTQ